MNRTEQAIWRFIVRYTDGHYGMPPTQAQIAQACGTKNVHYNLRRLIGAGVLNKERHQQRSLTVTIRPYPQRVPCPACRQPMRDFWQPSPFYGRPNLLLSDCQNPACALRCATLSAGEHELLTAEDIAGYERARLRSATHFVPTAQEGTA